jgi:hypothetical protein
MEFPLASHADELIDHFRSGGGWEQAPQEALVELIEEVERIARGITRSMADNKDHTWHDDMIGTLFLRLTERLVSPPFWKKFDPEKGSLAVYLAGDVRFVVMAQFRKEKDTKETLDSFSSLIESSDDTGSLQGFIDSLEFHQASKPPAPTSTSDALVAYLGLRFKKRTNSHLFSHYEKKLAAPATDLLVLQRVKARLAEIRTDLAVQSTEIDKAFNKIQVLEESGIQMEMSVYEGEVRQGMTDDEIKERNEDFQRYRGARTKLTKGKRRVGKLCTRLFLPLKNGDLVEFFGIPGDKSNSADKMRERSFKRWNQFFSSGDSQLDRDIEDICTKYKNAPEDDDD